MSGKIAFRRRVAYEWALRCFGYDHVSDVPVRALRNAEEAVELAQALNVPEQKMHDLVSMVYSRPVGTPAQEVGGQMLTLTILSCTLGLDPDECLDDELSRVLSKSREHFAKRNDEKNALGFGAQELPPRPSSPVGHTPVG